ncbi:MAG: hypothetical protein ABFQ95_01050 [Pseudomonadota bacterium]
MADFASIETDYEEFWQRAERSWVNYTSNALKSLQAYTGRTWTSKEISKLHEEGREASEYNLIRSSVNFFSGYARDNIKSCVIAPMEGSDEKTADQLNTVVKYVFDKGDGDQYLLSGFDDALKTGLSLVGIWIDKSEDPVFGDIKFFKRSYNSFILDPNFTRLDLSDCSEASLRDFVTRDDAKSLLTFIDPKIIDETPTATFDNKFQLYRPNKNRFDSDDLITYDSYYRRTTRDIQEIVDMSTGDILLRNGDPSENDKHDELVQLARSNGINAEILRRNKQFVELNVLLGGKVVYNGPDPTGLDTYPFIAEIACFEPQLDDFSLKIQGLVQPLIPAQRSFNRRLLRAQDIMDSSLNVGMLYKVGSVVDEKAMNRSGIGNIPATDTADLDRDFKPIQGGSIPPGWLEFSQTISGLFAEISGVNETLLGSDEGGNTQVSGRLAEVRAANGLRANRAIFDNFERSQRHLTKKALEAVQLNFGPGKVARIIGEEPTQQFNDESFERFDAVIKQGVKSQSQRDAFYFELLRAVEMFGPEKIPVDLIIEEMPMVGHSELRERIQQINEEQKQQEQQQKQQELELIQTQKALIDSQIKLNESSAGEKDGRQLSNIGLLRERESEQVQNIAQANLDRAKTLAEIQNLKTANIQQLMSFLQFLKQQEEQERQELISEDFSIAESLDRSSDINSLSNLPLNPINQGGQ